MRIALELALRGQGCVEPNPMVGCVAVRNNQVIAQGYHERFGGPHAERIALTNQTNLEGATVYVTLEPCSHFGKTPPCAPFVASLRPSRVVVAMEDPFPAVRGSGIKVLQDAGIDVVVGVCEEEARELNAPYLKLIKTGRPWVIAKWAMTLDGAIATALGDSKWISNEQSLATVHRLRSRLDAILIGIRTVLADDSRLTVRLMDDQAPSRTPIRVVLDHQARLPLSSYLATTAREIPVWLVVNDSADPDRVRKLESVGIRVIRVEAGSHSLEVALEELGKERCTNVMIEGGATLLGSAFDRNMIDQIECFIAPRIIGGQSLRPVLGDGHPWLKDASHWKLLHSETIMNDVHLTLRRLPSHKDQSKSKT